MVKRLGLSRLIALGGALLMVVVGIALCCFAGDRGATAAPETVAAITTAAVSPAAVAAAEASQPPGAVKDAGQLGAGLVKPAQTQASWAPQPAPDKAAAAEIPRRPTTSLRPQTEPRSAGTTAPRYPLPPFPPPDYASAGVAEASTGPAPNVLWLSGVIQGSPKLALLRRGENRYLVKEGGTFESYRVVKIGSNSVTIQRGSRKQMLRVGQY